VIEWSWYTHTRDEYCDMSLAFSACNGRAGTDASQYELRYSGRRLPDAIVVRRLGQRLLELESVGLMPTALMNFPPTGCTAQANQSAIIVAVEREPWRSSRDIALDLGLSQLRVFEVLFDDQLEPPLCFCVINDQCQ
jgi:hypothetical protein